MRRISLVALVLLVGCGDGQSEDVEIAQTPVADQQQPLEQQADGEWQTLFDGETLNGWTPRDTEGEWVVENGYITSAEGSPGGFLVSDESFGDVRIQVEFWADSIANGGVFTRVPETGEFGGDNAIEVNINDAHAQWPTGSISNVQRNDAPDTIGRWSTMEILHEGDRIVVTLDGEQVAEGTAPRSPTGHIALQHLRGEGEIRYRNIRVQPL